VVADLEAVAFEVVVSEVEASEADLEEGVLEVLLARLELLIVEVGHHLEELVLIE
jgi:hypothetical protein